MVKLGHLFALMIAAAPGLSGCGLYVPEIQEFPSKPGDAQLLVDAIVRSIHCELREGVRYVIDEDKKSIQRNGARTVPWFDTWGVGGVLTLTVAEKTEVNPTALWSPNIIFSLAGGIDGFAQATRIDTLNFYYNVGDLYTEAENELRQTGAVCLGGAGPHPVGSLLIDNNLKIKEWLETQMLPIGTGEITAITKNGITHDIKFEVSSTGSITPTWKLSRVISVNPSGTLLSTNRDRTHELAITFGPADPDQKALVGSAAAQFAASQFGIAIASHLKNALAP